jgi:RNA polymerase sigma factor (sigma-70 family)
MYALALADSSASPDLDEHDDQLEALTLKFEHRVHFFSRRVERRFGLAPVWHDDLVSAGYWGLLKALRNRRPEAHAHELSAYVSRRVEGAVIDEARQVLSRLSNHAHGDPFDPQAGVAGEGAEAEWSLAADADDPEEQADRHSRWLIVERSFDGLEDRQRDLLLAYAAGDSLAEIAREDGSSPARLQSQMTRVARQVRSRTPELRRILRHEL